MKRDAFERVLDRMDEDFKRGVYSTLAFPFMVNVGTSAARVALIGDKWCVTDVYAATIVTHIHDETIIEVRR